MGYVAVIGFNQSVTLKSCPSSEMGLMTCATCMLIIQVFIRVHMNKYQQPTTTRHFIAMIGAICVKGQNRGLSPKVHVSWIFV